MFFPIPGLAELAAAGNLMTGIGSSIGTLGDTIDEFQYDLQEDLQDYGDKYAPKIQQIFEYPVYDGAMSDSCRDSHYTTYNSHENPYILGENYAPQNTYHGYQDVRAGMPADCLTDAEFLNFTEYYQSPKTHGTGGFLFSPQYKNQTYL